MGNLPGWKWPSQHLLLATFQLTFWAYLVMVQNSLPKGHSNLSSNRNERRRRRWPGWQRDYEFMYVPWSASFSHISPCLEPPPESLSEGSPNCCHLPSNFLSSQHLKLAPCSFVLANDRGRPFSLSLRPDVLISAESVMQFAISRSWRWRCDSSSVESRQVLHLIMLIK